MTNQQSVRRIQLATSIAVCFAIGAPIAAAKPSARQTASRIDAQIAEAVTSSGTDAAPVCDDTTFIRRVTLDLVGDIPAPEEVVAFVLDPASDKRSRAVRRLLDDPRFGQNRARYWRDVILYRRVEDRAVLASNALTVHLAERFNDNVPWDRIAAEFITATGDVRENGATAIFFSQDGRTEESTAEFARIFLGIQIQCAQCHDHPYDAWKREQFHELAAFFPRVGVRPVRSATKRSFEVVANDRARRRRPNSDNAKRRGAPEHYMPDLEHPTKPGKLMTPTFFLTGATLPVGTDDADRRGQIAAWFTDSDWFATAYVNRVWAELVGRGFYVTIDDIGPERDANAPEAIAALSAAFGESGFDVHWLYRTICMTKAYQRESRPRDSNTADPFAANVAQPLRADQLFNALLTVLEIDEAKIGGRNSRSAGDAAYRRRARAREAFNGTFGYDPSDRRENISASIPQVLTMMNSPQFANATRAMSSRTMLGRLLAATPENADVVHELYLRCYSREPKENEAANVLAFVDRVGDRRAAFEDVLWALLNSAEFRFRR